MIQYIHDMPTLLLLVQAIGLAVPSFTIGRAIWRKASSLEAPKKRRGH